MSNVKFLKGLKSQLPTLGVDDSSLYFVEDTGEIYKGVGSGQPLVKLGDVLSGFSDLEDLQLKNPAIQGKLYLTDNRELFIYDGVEYKLVSGAEAISADKIVETESHKVMTAEERIKLEGIEENANYYVHPDKHLPSEIATDELHQFVSQAEKENWNDKYTKTEVDNKISAVVSNLEWKESVDTYEDLYTTYPNPREGWTVGVNDTNIVYRFDETEDEWIPISANSIPLATHEVDGKLSKEDKTKLDGISSGATKVEASSINGNIKIDGNEVKVYSLEWESFGI